MKDISNFLENIHFNQYNNRNLYYVKFIKNINVQEINTYCLFIKNNYEFNIEHCMYNNLCLMKKKIFIYYWIIYYKNYFYF